jgi:hypothetical protein
MAKISAPAFMEGYRLMGFNPNKAFDVPALNIAEKLPYPTVGIDLATGEREINLQQQPKKESKVVYDKQATPLEQIQFDYALLDELEKKRLERSMVGYQMQQAADLAALPQYSQAIFDMASKTRGLDYQLGLAADTFSPTRQQARIASEESSAADRDRAIAAQAQAAGYMTAAAAPRSFGRRG